jgi:hypothetical protein
MASGGDLIELVHEQTYLGQNINNVYYFTAVASTTLTTLTSWFEANVVPKVKLVQTDLVNHINLRTRNVFVPAETYEEPLTGVGSKASGTVELPAFMAYTIRLDHENGNVRPGFKRYVGVEELGITDALLVAGIITDLTTLGGVLVNPASTANPQFNHVVVGRVCETPNPVSGAQPSCLKYRLPESTGELEVGIITTVEVYAQPTTQNSRKWYT